MISQNLIFSLTCSSLFFLSLQYSFQLSNANCTPSSCGLLRNITFPFRHNNDPKNCGGPKFELICKNDIASIHLNSNKYYVKAIDYRNYTMRVAYVSINSSSASICSFPNSSVFDYPPPFESHSSWLIHFISCQHPLHNPSLFTPVTGCGKGGYTYVKVGDLLVQDMDYTCTLEAVTLTSWNFTERYPNNASPFEIHQYLLYEFDLSWIMFECRHCKSDCFVGPDLQLFATSAVMISITTGVCLLYKFKQHVYKF